MEFVRNIIYRPEASNLFDSEKSLGHLIIKNLLNAGDQTLIVCDLTGQKLSARELVNNSIKIAKALIASAIKEGDVVSIVSENRFEFVYVLFGTIFLNCAFAPLNHAYTERELAHAFNLSKPKFIFTSGSTTKRIVNVTQKLSYVKKIIFFDESHQSSIDSRMNDLTVSLNDFTNILQNVNFEPKPIDILTCKCLIMCSSGTTGFPKGVQLSQSAILACAHAFTQNILTRSNAGDEEIVILGLLPMFHILGIAVLIATMATGAGKIILLPKFEETTFLGSIQKYRCTVAFLVPPLLVFLAKNPNVDKYDLSSLSFVFSGAAPLSKEIEDAVKDRIKTSSLIIKQGYAMTEVPSLLSQKNIVKHGSVGDVNPNIFAKVINENGKALGPNQVGELCFKSGGMMMGYIGDNEATKAIIDEDGWLHTGDVGYYDNDLQFYIVDRIKELIKYNGFQVAPAEIEALLLTHSKIKDCGVIGKPDDIAGELPMAFIVKDDLNLTEAEIVQYVYEKSSSEKRLHGGVRFIDQIPKNPSGKILRRELRNLLTQEDVKSKL